MCWPMLMSARRASQHTMAGHRALRSDAVLWVADHARCNELPRLLATAQGTGTPLEWSL
jgi:hypothetical protein